MPGGQVLGDYYASDGRNVWSAMWTDLGRCLLVAPDKEGDKIYWFR